MTIEELLRREREARLRLHDTIEMFALLLCLACGVAVVTAIVAMLRLGGVS